MQAHNIGDRVKVVGNNRPQHRIPLGSEGVIVDGSTSPNPLIALGAALIESSDMSVAMVQPTTGVPQIVAGEDLEVLA